MVERRLLSANLIRVTVASVTRLSVAAPVVILGRPGYLVGKRQIELAIIVIIEPCGARRPLTFVRHTSSIGNIREGTVAVVMVKDRTVVTEHDQIGVPVVVVIPNSNAHPE